MAVPSTFLCLPSLGDNLFGYFPVVCEGVWSCVSVVPSSCLASCGHVAVVIHESLFHVGGELVDASLLDVPESVFNLLCDVVPFLETRK